METEGNRSKNRQRIRGRLRVSSVSVSDLSVICFIRSSGKQLGEKSEVLGDNWTTVPNLDGFDAPLVSSSSDAYLRIQVEVYSASNLAS